MSEALHVEALAVRGDEAARLIGVSPRHFRALDSSGRVPRGVRLSRVKVWLVSDLRRWLESGAPPREEWEARKEAAR